MHLALLLPVFLVLVCLPETSTLMDCRASCQKCFKASSMSEELEIYCSMCKECRDRNHDERVQGTRGEHKGRPGGRGRLNQLAKWLGNLGERPRLPMGLKARLLASRGRLLRPILDSLKNHPFGKDGRAGNLGNGVLLVRGQTLSVDAVHTQILSKYASHPVNAVPNPEHRVILAQVKTTVMNDLPPVQEKYVVQSLSGRLDNELRPMLIGDQIVYLREVTTARAADCPPPPPGCEEVTEKVLLLAVTATSTTTSTTTTTTKTSAPLMSRSCPPIKCRKNEPCCPMLAPPSPILLVPPPSMLPPPPLILPPPPLMLPRPPPPMLPPPPFIFPPPPLLPQLPIPMLPPPPLLPRPPQPILPPLPPLPPPIMAIPVMTQLTMRPPIPMLQPRGGHNGQSGHGFSNGEDIEDIGMSLLPFDSNINEEYTGNISFTDYLRKKTTVTQHSEEDYYYLYVGVPKNNVNHIKNKLLREGVESNTIPTR